MDTKETYDDIAKSHGGDPSYSSVNMYISGFKLGMQPLINLHIPLICFCQSSMDRAISYKDNVCSMMVCTTFITLHLYIIHIWYFHIRNHSKRKTETQTYRSFFTFGLNYHSKIIRTTYDNYIF